MVAKVGYVKKADLIAKICSMSEAEKTVLEDLAMERLHLIHDAIKPQKVRVMPSNWKRFSKAEMAQLYREKIQPLTQEFLTFTKPRMIAELEMYVQETEEEMDRNGVLQTALGPPMCVRCKIPMIERVNRVTRAPFWGCLAFPTCRETMAMEYHGRPAAEIQMEFNPDLKVDGSAAGSDRKMKQADDKEVMDGATLVRAVRKK